MTNLKTPKLLAAAISASVLLTACGGGGGGDSSGSSSNTSENPISKVVQNTATIRVDENSSSTFGVDGSIKNVTAERPVDLITVNASDSSITIKVDELTKEETARYTIEHRVDGAPHETILTIKGVNASAAAMVAQADAMVNTPTSQLAFYDTERLSSIVLEIQYLAGQISESEKAGTKASIQSAIDQAAQDTKALKDSLAEALTAYRAGQIGEQSLAQKLADMEGGIDQVSDLGNIVLDSFSTTLSELGVTLPAGMTLAYDDQIERYTRFKDANLGSYDENGKWVFAPEYDWLNAALTLAQGQ